MLGEDKARVAVGGVRQRVERQRHRVGAAGGGDGGEAGDGVPADAGIGVAVRIAVGESQVFGRLAGPDGDGGVGAGERVDGDRPRGGGRGQRNGDAAGEHGNEGSIHLNLLVVSVFYHKDAAHARLVRTTFCRAAMRLRCGRNLLPPNPPRKSPNLACRAIPHNQRGAEERLARRRVGAVDARHEHAEGEVGELVAGLVGGGERRRGDGGVVDVVEAGHLDVFGHAAAELRERGDEEPRLAVVVARERVGAERPQDPADRRGVVRPRVDRRALHRLPLRADLDAEVAVLHAGRVLALHQVGDALRAAADEMLADAPPRLDVVHGGEVVAAALRRTDDVAVEEHHRHARRIEDREDPAVDRLGVPYQLDGLEDDSVHACFHEVGRRLRDFVDTPRNGVS